MLITQTNQLICEPVGLSSLLCFLLYKMYTLI